MAREYCKVPMSPAAPGQEEIWLSCALENEAPLFTVSIGLVLKGRLNTPLLEQAIDGLIARHEILRTTYHPGLRGLMQQVEGHCKVKVTLCDLSGLDAESRKVAGTAIHREEVQARFDLRQGPVLRARLIKHATREYALLLSVHHIAIDGWSMGVLARDLGQIYWAYRRGERPVLQELALRYRDFAKLQRERLAEKSRRITREVKERFRAPPLLFRTEKPCPAGSYWEGERVKLRFPQLLHEQVAAFGARVKVTRFIAFMAVLWIVLYAYSRRTRFVMAADYANRGDPDSESVIGLFVSQLLLKGAVDANATFMEVMRAAQRELQLALGYAECPVSSLLPDGSDPKAAPPFRVKLAFQPRIDHPDFTDAEVVAVNIWSEWAKFDLLFSVNADTGGTAVELQYRKAMFDRSDMAAMLADVERLTRLVLDQPQASVASLVEKLGELREGHGKSALEQIKSRTRSMLRAGAEDLATLTESGRLPGLPEDKISPLMVRARVKGVSLRHWVEAHKALIEEHLKTHRAVLFRDFHISSDEFTEVSSELMGELMSYVEGATPRVKKSAKTYSSTQFPHDEAIELHNELSSAMTIPGRIAFYCAQPAESGGATPLADVHQVYSYVPQSIREEFASRGWMLIRNFHKGFGLTWQQAFETQDRSVVEDYCSKNDLEYVWEPDGNLRLTQIRSAVMSHPFTQLPVWFNHVAFWHESRLESGLRDLLLKEFGRSGLPFSTYFGDGAPIATETIDVIRAAYSRARVSFPWQRNDLLYLDNIGTAHGRTAYTGARDVAVSMGQPYRREPFRLGESR